MEKIDLDKIYEQSNLKWLSQNVIYLTRYGSYAYGTNVETSDIDIRGITMVPKKYLFGILDNFEQAIFSKPYDATIFALNKFVALSMQGNPNALEIIFTDSTDHLFINEIGQSLLDIRDLFISKKCRHSFAGYAFSQVKRIATHRKYILNPILKKPERSDFNLPDTHKLIPEHQLLEIEAQIKHKVEEWNIDTTGMEPDAQIKFKNELSKILLDLKLNNDDMDMYAARSLGLNDALTESFRKERIYKCAMRDYSNYETWKKERNKSRYAMEEKYHYDLKHGMHLVRLFRMCVEILRDGKLNVKRLDADELLEIRSGSWSYDKLMQYANDQNLILYELYKVSKIPNEPDRVKINDWLIDINEKHSII
jgi:uncharacterized protein